jgi:predicted secreted protein
LFCFVSFHYCFPFSQKPAKIKLKRNTKGEYSWDISGDDADKVLEANRKLKESLEKKKKGD